jgi:hypothetical protein
MGPNLRTANVIASTLPSFRVALLFGAALVLTESAVLATSLFVAACVTFIASLLIAARIYRVRAPRATDGDALAAPSDDADR